MLSVLAVVLCRLLVACAGVAVGVLDSGACFTVLAVASIVPLRVLLSLPVCPSPASHTRFLPLSPLAPPATSSPAACTCEPALASSLVLPVVCVFPWSPASAGRVPCAVL